MDFRPTAHEPGAGGLTDTLMVFLLPLLFLLMLILWPVSQARRYYGLRFRGFWVQRKGRDAIEYQELHDGRIDRLTIDGEMMAIGPHVVYIPSDAEWQQKMPGWARGRRAEIVEKVKRGLDARNYEYDLS